VRMEHVGKGPGLYFRLCAQKHIFLGPVEFEMNAGHIGEGAIDLLRRVLPACTQQQNDVHNGNIWASPVLLVPLAHMQGGICRAACGLGGTVAHVAVIFRIDHDPDTIMKAASIFGWKASFSKLASASFERLASFERFASFEIDAKFIDTKVAEVEQIIDKRMLSVAKVERLFLDRTGKTIRPHVEPLLRNAQTKLSKILEPIDLKLQPQKAKLDSIKALTMSVADAIIENPDIHHKGWVSHRMANGRTFWHHEALGPPPWNVTQSVSKL